MSSERLIKSLERLIMLQCKPKSQPHRNWIPRPHQACNDSTPVHIVIHVSTAESLGHTIDALATAPEPHRDWGLMHPPQKKKKKKIVV